jgi:hypothetical protein
MTSEPAPRALEQLVGSWTTEATHPSLPGSVVRGTVAVEWLEGERFLIHRSRSEHPAFPDAISILGFAGSDRVGDATGNRPTANGAPELTMHYFDSRGVSRVYDTSIDKHAWCISRVAPGFSQRFIGTFADGGDTITGLWRLCEDDIHWSDDLRITYRRVS